VSAFIVAADLLADAEKGFFDLTAWKALPRERFSVSSPLGYELACEWLCPPGKQPPAGAGTTMGHYESRDLGAVMEAARARVGPATPIGAMGESMGAGHAMSWETDREAYAGRVRAFLGRHLPAAATPN
jgi:hypothetical protein